MEGNMDIKHLLLFYKQKIILLENQNSFLLNQNIFLQHQIDQNNQIILNVLNNNNNLQKYNNNLQKPDLKDALMEEVKISKLPKGKKSLQKEKKAINKRKNIFIIGDSMIKGLAEKGISKNVKVSPHPRCTTNDIKDHVKPILCKDPDAIIIHSENNDVTNGKQAKR